MLLTHFVGDACSTESQERSGFTGAHKEPMRDRDCSSTTQFPCHRFWKLTLILVGMSPIQPSRQRCKSDCNLTSPGSCLVSRHVSLSPARQPVPDLLCRLADRAVLVRLSLPVVPARLAHLLLQLLREDRAAPDRLSRPEDQEDLARPWVPVGLDHKH